jgi:hypothetical protein
LTASASRSKADLQFCSQLPICKVFGMVSAILQPASHLQVFWNGICNFADGKPFLQTVTPLVIAQRICVTEYE